VNHFSKLLSSYARLYPRGLTNLAKKARLSRPSLYDALNGKSIPRPETMERILNALELGSKVREEIHLQHKLILSLSTREKRERFHRSKEDFAQEIGGYLLGKGFELSYLSSHQEANIVVRKGKIFIPILTLPMIHDYSQTLGAILLAMHNFSSQRGFVCLSKLSGLDRKKGVIFENYGATVTTCKSLHRMIAKI